MVFITIFPTNLVLAQENSLFSTVDSEISQNDYDSESQTSVLPETTSSEKDEEMTFDSQGIEKKDVEAVSEDLLKGNQIKSDGLSVAEGNVTYPNGADSIVATVDWFTYSLSLNLPPLNAGESVTLSLGDVWDTSKNDIIIGNYLIEPIGNGEFKITAQTDSPQSTLDLNLFLRYKENISSQTEEIPIEPKLTYQDLVVTGDPVMVNVTQFVETVPSKELIKKTAIGKTSTGHAAWVIYWNYNNIPLGGYDGAPFEFKDIPLNGQRIIEGSVLAYNVNNPINPDGTRNLDHDSYDFLFSSYLNSHLDLDTGELIIKSNGDDEFLKQYSNQAFYIYFETTIPEGLEDSQVINEAWIKGGAPGSGSYDYEDFSDAGLSGTPISGGNQKRTLSVNKVWEDSNNQDGLRPEKIIVELYDDQDSLVSSVELSESNHWEHTWSNLNIGVNYKVKEKDVPQDYHVSVEQNSVGNFVITNTHTPEETEISGTKTWNDANNQDGKRPDKIKVSLLADGKEVASQEVSASSQWTYHFKHLPKYANGQLIQYQIKEDAVSGYTATYNGHDIENSYEPSQTNVTVDKVWKDSDNQDGIRPNSIKVQLYANGQPKGQVVELTDTMNWRYQWLGLPKYSKGQVITYTVKEVDPPKGYTTTIDESDPSHFIIANTHTPGHTDIGGSQSGNSNTFGYSNNHPNVNQEINNDKNKKKLPSTGEQYNLSIMILGICILSYIALKYWLKVLKNIE